VTYASVADPVELECTHLVHGLLFESRRIRLLAILNALRERLPVLYEHVRRALTGIVLVRARDVCGPRSAACTGGPWLGRLAAIVDFDKRSDAEVGALLVHEALHWRDIGCGTFVPAGHTCSDGECLNPIERSRDTIYQAEDYVRSVLSLPAF
jgi:hypothetical protein